MTLGSAMRASASGLVAERFRMEVSAENIANANSMRTRTQEAYRRQIVILETTPEGVRIRQTAPDQSPFPRRLDPGNPNAINGEVVTSNVQPLLEMTNMMSAARAYEANIAAFNTAKSMARQALEIGKA